MKTKMPAGMAKKKMPMKPTDMPPGHQHPMPDMARGMATHPMTPHAVDTPAEKKREGE